LAEHAAALGTGSEPYTRRPLATGSFQSTPWPWLDDASTPACEPMPRTPTPPALGMASTPVERMPKVAPTTP
jgi:hypothetical protein